jgi:carboxylate-amine ligase
LTAPDRTHPPGAQDLRAAFDAAEPYTVGIEDEVMLLEPNTLDLAPRARDVISLLDGDARFKLELPASQLEILTPACRTVADAARELTRGRRDLAQRVDGAVRLAGAGVHPFSSGIGELNELPRYERTIREYGGIANRQLVCAFQVHVAVGDAERALSVYNEARSYLPLLAALAANAPYYEGRDTGLASVRPKLAELLPRQGIPPALPSWEAYAQALEWGARSGAFPEARTWWWELRPHPRFGTLEFRVPDGQATVADGAAVAAVAQALTAWLADRVTAGEQEPPAETWRIEENRWSACRFGVEGKMADPRDGTVRETRAWLKDLLEWLDPVASRLGSQGALRHAQTLIDVNGAIAQRRAAAEGGAFAACGWLAQRFLWESPG